MAPGLARAGPRASSKDSSRGAGSKDGAKKRKSATMADMSQEEMLAQFGPHAAARRNSLPAGAQDDEVVWRAACELKDFVVRKEGSSLRAWTKHFDTDNDQRISQNEFIRGMRKMNYQGDPAALFATLDADSSGELALEEIDANAADKWLQFRAFCVRTFDDPTDMVKKLGRPIAPSEPRRGISMAKETHEGEPVVSLQQLVDGMRAYGYPYGYEDVIFSALNVNDKAAINEDELKWLDQEQKRQKRKDAAKKKALIDRGHKRDNNWKNSEATLADFKQFLKRKYGNYLRAWRSALSPDGSMVLQRSILFKACTALGWQGDVRLLYKAFDKDDSGYISIEELDAHAAELLAHFHEFIGKHFGSASAAFQALDKFNQKNLKQREFCAASKSFGFQHSAKAIFQGLDYQGRKALNEEDLLFLDRWKPPAFLTRPANPQSMEDVKQMLIKTYKNFLKAWRHLLDTDSSNRCNYDEFEAACKKLNFKGDVPGAWRALDEDLSGYITLQEIDPTSSKALADFRKWCDQEFGSVRSAFGVFDSSGDDEATYREWRRALRIYGFTGNASTLFYALDVERNGSLSVDEVEFLDDWTFPEASDDVQAVEPSMKELGLTPSHPMQLTTQYYTDVPGPGAYDSASTIGAGPLSPMLRFPGAYSFRGRTHGFALPGVQHDAAQKPAPVDYDDLESLSAIRPSKPSWGFGTEIRKVTETLQSETTPGPGQYSPAMKRTAAALTCTPRRPLRVHPLFRNLGVSSPRDRELSYSPRKERSEAVAALPKLRIPVQD